MTAHSEMRQRAEAAAARLVDALAVPPPPEPGTDRGPASPRWRAQSLAKGAAGVAVLHAMRHRAGLGDAERAHSWLRAATREELIAAPGAGLWFGAPAIAFAVAATSHTGQYPRALRRLDGGVAALATARLEAAWARIAAARRPARAEFDLVCGLAGLGAYLLVRDPHGAHLRQVLAYLVRLAEPLPCDDQAGRHAPGWWTDDLPVGRPEAVFHGGHGDLGMAHGICGPLALLALSMRNGIVVDGQTTALERICDWLDAWRQESAAGAWWPQRVTAAELAAGQPAAVGPTRGSWCYGTPGLARAQQLAALALGDPDRQRRAEDALAACLADPSQLEGLTDAALCHGWAGVLATARCAAADAGSAQLTAHLPVLLDQVLQRVPSMESEAGSRPGLIEGGAGVAAALHTLATGTRDLWETSLLINAPAAVSTGPAVQTPATPGTPARSSAQLGEDRA